MASADFRAIVSSGFQAERVEPLGGHGRPGPGPGEAGWPETPNAASARVTRAQDYSQSLRELCHRFSEETSHRVSVNLYVSPPQSRGLDRHQDGHDVLVLQLEGSKRWRVWASDAPPPLDEMPTLSFERAKRFRNDYRGTPFGGHGISDSEVAGKPSLDFTLSAGDLLYVPGGWTHEVWTEEFHSAHLTFGFHMVTWVDLVSTMLAQASRQHGMLREGLPIGFARLAPDQAFVREKALAALPLVASMDASEAMEEVIGRWLLRDADAFSGPPRPSPPGSPPPGELDVSSIVHRRAQCTFVTRDDSVGLFSPMTSAGMWLPPAFGEALRYIATVEPPVFRVLDLPGLSPRSRVHLCARLVTEGFLEVGPVGKVSGD